MTTHTYWSGLVYFSVQVHLECEAFYLIFLLIGIGSTHFGYILEHFECYGLRDVIDYDVAFNYVSDEICLMLGISWPR